MKTMAEVLAEHHALDFEDARPMDVTAEQASQLRWMVEWKCVCGEPLEHDPTTPATADETLIKAHAAHQADMLSAAGFGDVQEQQARLDKVAALAEKWRYKGEFGWGAWQEGYGPDPEGLVLDHAAAELRAALTATGAAS